MELVRHIDITSAFLAVCDTLAGVIFWCQNTYIDIATKNISLYDLAVGALVIGTIIKEFIPWSDEDEAGVLWED